jgi:16S rRNA (cytidine1402-2'-O)-methyltransferase
VLFESPQRIVATLVELRDALGAARPAVIARELTKLHEEILRGTLAELTDAVAARSLRGECVVVIGPVPRAEVVVDDAEILSALERALAAGASKRDAASGVAAELGVAKRRAYELAVAIPSSTRLGPP